MAKVKSEEEIVKVSPEQIKIIETTIETKLAANKITDQQIALWEKEVKGLKIDGIEDKDGYDAVYEFRQKAKRTRILTVDICKAGRAPLIAETKEWISRENKYVERFEAMESICLAQEKAIDDEKNRVKAEKAQAQIERNKIRVARLKELGVEWDGSAYSLDGLEYGADVIRETEDDFFEGNIIPKFKALYDSREAIAKANREAKELEEKLQREAKEKFEQEQKEFREAQEKLRLDQEKLQREEKERKEKKEREEKEEADKKNAAWKKEQDDKLKARLNQLTGLGLKYNFGSGNYENFDVFIHNLDITTYDDEKWDATIKKTATHIEDYKKRQAEIEKERQDHQYQIDLQKALDEKKEQEKLAEVKRQEEIEEGKESVKYEETVKYLKATPIYKFKSGRYISKMRIIKDFLSDLE